MALSTFFSIKPPNGEDALSWAKEMWDTFGFDYDIERCGPCVFAWPCNDAETPEQATKELSDALEADDIEFTTFEADADELFGIEKTP